MSILIVDDVPDNVTVLRALLAGSGYADIVSASNAMQAYQALGFETGQTSVDVILMDIMMPDVTGLDACRRIKSESRLRDIPVIMVTAKAEQESLQEAFAAGAMDYITKPIRKMELLARVGSALKLKRETDARKQREQELTEKNRSLEKAMNEIKVLRGFIPICAKCKKIRNVEGLWQQIEVYITEHSEAVFSHGFCNDCIEQLYPGHAPKNKPAL